MEDDSVVLLALGLAVGEVKNKAPCSSDGTLLVVVGLILGMAKPILQHNMYLNNVELQNTTQSLATYQSQHLVDFLLESASCS